jgi:hypothetical protein
MVLMNNESRRAAVVSLVSAIALAAALAAAPAWAALDIQREVSITTDTGGTLLMIGSGQRDELGAESTTTAAFTAFAVDADARRIDGEVVRSRVATGEQVETVYDGALEILTPAAGDQPERLDTVVFEALTVTRSGDGPELSGSVIFNGRSIDAGELPRPALRALTRVLRFFAYA